jgi:hypothetical protein
MANSIEFAREMRRLQQAGFSPQEARLTVVESMAGQTQAAVDIAAALDLKSQAQALVDSQKALHDKQVEVMKEHIKDYVGESKYLQELAVLRQTALQELGYLQRRLALKKKSNKAISFQVRTIQ